MARVFGSSYLEQKKGFSSFKTFFTWNMEAATFASCRGSPDHLMNNYFTDSAKYLDRLNELKAKYHNKLPAVSRVESSLQVHHILISVTKRAS